MTSRIVYLLRHSRDVGGGTPEEKLVGVFSARSEAEAAIKRKLGFEGFRDYPAGFLVAEYELDRDA